ncbi:MAG TPA: UPF0182 family protein, partial [Candidatus Avamphibacillus sp.]|nr:UPF0182 family protein [Candidatus Avamphibacillus sp.]
LLAIPIEDTVLYVEPIYIESSNETSLPEVKQVVMAYEDHIVMEATFDKALEEIFNSLDPDKAKKGKDEDEEEDEEAADQQEEGETPDEPIMGADELLGEISEMFDDYRAAISDGKYEEAGKIMEEIEARLEQGK